MKVISDIESLREWAADKAEHPRVLVPTMGALHRGHTSLFDLARESAGKRGDVVATIFVNPTQFAPNEDLDAYPRQLDSDLEKCKSHGVDLVFAPEADTMYTPDASTVVNETTLSRRLCGASRPGHFSGVCTVVAKLFNLTGPDAAVFGEKDFQQLAIIQRMVRDLNFRIKIIPGPTVREDDGLAMSSRNAYLNKEERSQAPIIFRTLSDVVSKIKNGTLTNPEQALNLARKNIETASRAKIDYLEMFHPDTLDPLLRESIQSDSKVRMAAAVFFGKTRLIDNLGIS